MKPTLNNYIAVNRRCAGLTQAELATLIGGRTGSKISRLEWSKAEPDFDAAIVCELIFDVSLHELFPGKYRDHVQALARKIRRLAAELPPPNKPGMARKYDLLDNVLDRLKSLEEQL